MLNFLRNRGPGTEAYPSDPQALEAPYIQAREFADGHTEYIAWTCHPALLLDDHSSSIPQVIDNDGQSFTPQVSAVDDGDEIPRFESMESAEEAVRLYSEIKARNTILREDLLSAEITYLEQRLAELRRELSKRPHPDDDRPANLLD